MKKYEVKHDALKDTQHFAKDRSALSCGLGIAVHEDRGFLEIYGLHTKGRFAPCGLSLDVKSIGDLINVLTDIEHDRERKAAKKIWEDFLSKLEPDTGEYLIYTKVPDKVNRSKFDYELHDISDEPDVAVWKYQGFDCGISRHPSLGTFCGYVVIPPEHPSHLFRDEEWYHYLHVHGGVTFSRSSSQLYLGEYLKGWMIGFDCAHSGDLTLYKDSPRL
jgi:hypothetical protein